MEVSTQTPQVRYVDASSQTEHTISQQTAMSTLSGAELIKGDNTRTEFYTALPTWDVFVYVFSILVLHIPKKRTSCTG